MSKDPLRLSTPFPTDVDAIFSNAQFIAPEQFDNGNTCQFEVLASPTEDEDFTPFRINWKVCSLGYMNNDGEWQENWEIVDGGRAIRNLSDASKTFSNRSRFGKVFTGMMALNGLEKVLRDRISDGVAAGPNEAALFDNLVVHIDEVEAPYKFKNDDGEMVEGVSTYYMVTDFIGEHGEKKTVKKAAPKAKAAPAATSIDAEWVTKFDNLMDDCLDLDEFEVRATSDPGFEDVVGDVALAAWVAEQVAAGETSDFYQASLERSNA
jgi:hypothetical protein